MDVLQADILVVGGGGAGLRAAIAARKAGADVLVVNKGNEVTGGATSYLDKLIEFTGLGVSIGKEESQLYYEELLHFSHGINSSKIVKTLTDEDESELAFLEDIGVEFEKEGQDYQWLKLPVHTRPRVLRGKDDFGTHILTKLVKECHRIGVRFLLQTDVCEVIKNHHGYPCSAYAVKKGTPPKKIKINFSKVILAAGGIGNLFSSNTNPQGNGSGMAIAFELGATLTNIEFTQILPLLVSPIRGYFIISSLLARGELSNVKGDVFSYTEKINLEKLDEVTQGKIVLEMCRWIEQQQEQGLANKDGSVYWTGKNLTELMCKRIPRTLEILKERGLDLLTEPAKISVGCHQALGGIAIDHNGRTDVHGLYACGECAGNFQGAERLMGTGVIDALVFGKRAGEAAAQDHITSMNTSFEEKEEKLEIEDSETILWDVQKGFKELHQTMDRVLVSKNETKLKAAKENITKLYNRIKLINKDQLPINEWRRISQFKHATLMSKLLVEASLLRNESRGGFIRTDFPNKDDQYESASIIKKSDRHSYKIKIGNKITEGCLK